VPPPPKSPPPPLRNDSGSGSRSCLHATLP
jgi:hypothetical protein